MAGSAQNWKGWKRKWTNKDFQFYVFLAAIFLHTHGWKWNLAALVRFSIPSLLANSFRPFVFCFLQPWSLQWFQLPRMKQTFFSFFFFFQPDPELSNNSGKQVEVLRPVTLWHFHFHNFQIFYFKGLISDRISGQHVEWESVFDLKGFCCCLTCATVQISQMGRSQREEKLWYSKRDNQNSCWSLLHFYFKHRINRNRPQRRATPKWRSCKKRRPGIKGRGGIRQLIWK